MSKVFQFKGVVNSTAAEDNMAILLDHAGYEYEKEFKFHPTRKWRADFHIPLKKLLIEVDGILYSGYGGHQTGVGFQKDLEKINTAVLMGFTVLRFTPAMVNGKAKATAKSKTRMAPAIDVIDEFMLGHIPEDSIREHQGYALRILSED